MEQSANRWFIHTKVVPANSHLSKFREDGCFINIILKGDVDDGGECHWSLPEGAVGAFKEGEVDTVWCEPLELAAARAMKEQTNVYPKMLVPIGTFPDKDGVVCGFFTMLISSDDNQLPFKAEADNKKVGVFNLKGKFDAESGELTVKLRCVEHTVNIGFKAVFTRVKFGMLACGIAYLNEESEKLLSLVDAEIIARAILRAPDLVMPTKDKFGQSKIEHEELPPEQKVKEVVAQVQ